MKRHRIKRDKKRSSRARKIRYVVLLAVLLALGFWIKSRWRAWFVSPPEEPFTLSEQIQRVALTPGEDGVDDRTVSWITAVDKEGNPKDFKVALYRTPSDTLPLQVVQPASRVVDTRGGSTAMYSVAWKNLDTGKYLYAIEGDNDSFRDSFEIRSREILEDTLIYLGDIQEKHDGWAKEIFSDISKKVPTASLWCFGGDAIERGHQQYWDIWYNSVSDFASKKPMVAVPGNHEYNKGIFKAIDARWPYAFNFPQNGPKESVGRSYYIDYPNFRLIGIDSQGIELNSQLFPSRRWLKEVLASRGNRFAIVMFHHAVYCVREGRLNPFMRYGFRSILEDKTTGADLVLQAHDHAYSRIINKGNGETLTTPVYIISVCSQKVYRNGFDEIHDKIASGIPLYQTIRVGKDSLFYASYTTSHELYDSLIITKNRAVADLGKDIPEQFKFEFPNTPKGEKKRAKYAAKVEKRLAMKQKK
ncbi:MAG: metallophosphoesterase [Porphyromonas sp.]|nr:metallophosphoesterase [Porphyromonas sp.]